MEGYGRRLFHSLVDMGHSFQHIRFFEELTNSTFITLCVIERAGVERPGVPGITVSDLSAQLEISRPAVTKTVNLLESRGMVERIGRRDDRRCVYVTLTDRGREVLRTAESSVSRIMDRVSEKMGAADTEELIRLVTKLSQCYLEYEREEIEEKEGVFCG